MRQNYYSTSLIIVLVLFLTGCTDSKKVDPNEITTLEIGSMEYSKLVRNGLIHLQNFEFDEWGELFADDVKIYFPDGDIARTVIEGKGNVVGFYSDWHKTSGIQSLKFDQVVFIPIVAKEALVYSNLTGPLVIIYCSVHYNYNGNEFAIRANYVYHFNEEKLIDRWYMYYDRTPIIEATLHNILHQEQMK